jgi:hypothetical protein
MERTNPADFALKSDLVCEALIALGDLRRAELLADLAYRYAGGRLREVWAALALARVKRLLGPAARKEAEDWTSRALALASEIGSRWGLAAANIAAAELAADRGDQSGRAEHAERAVTLANEIGLSRIAERAAQIRNETVVATRVAAR